MTDQTFACVLSADLVGRVVNLVSTEPTRYYLHGFKVEPAPRGEPGAVLVATDGHALVALYDPDAIVSGEAIVKVDAATLKALRVTRELDRRVLVVSDGRATVRGGVLRDERQQALDGAAGEVEAIQVTPALIDGQFPDWRRVVPTGAAQDGRIGVIDNRLLERLAKALCEHGTRSSRGLRVTTVEGSGTTGPHRVLGSEYLRGFGVAMPMRGSGYQDAGSLPSWFHQTPAVDLQIAA